MNLTGTLFKSPLPLSPLEINTEYTAFAIKRKPRENGACSPRNRRNCLIEEHIECNFFTSS